MIYTRPGYGTDGPVGGPWDNRLPLRWGGVALVLPAWRRELWYLDEGQDTVCRPDDEALC